MIALRQQLGMADLNRSHLNVLRDILIIPRCGEQHLLDLRLMREVGYLSSPHRLSAIVFGRMHTLRNARSG